MGMISDMYTQEIGPNDREKIMLTRKMKNTPPIDIPRLVPSGFNASRIEAHISEIVIPIEP